MALFGKSGSSKKKSSEKSSSSKNTGESRVICDHMPFAAKEAYKRLRTNVVFSFPNEGKCRIVGVTSAQPGEGKTVSAINLAYSMAEQGKKVLFIDADMRRSSVAKKLNLNRSHGLSNLMVDVSDVKSVINRYITGKGISFDIIVAGSAPPNPAELLGSERMKKLLTTLAEVYDYIIVDLPPICAVVDALSVASMLDGMIFVIREEITTKSAISYCVEQLKFSGVKILGFLVNGTTEGVAKKYSYKGYRKYGYGYYGKYGKYGSYGYYGGYGYYGKYAGYYGSDSGNNSRNAKN